MAHKKDVERLRELLDGSDDAVRKRLNEVLKRQFDGGYAEMGRAIGWDRRPLHRILTGETKRVPHELVTDTWVQLGLDAFWLTVGLGTPEGKMTVDDRLVQLARSLDLL